MMLKMMLTKDADEDGDEEEDADDEHADDEDADEDGDEEQDADDEHADDEDADEDGDEGSSTGMSGLTRRLQEEADVLLQGRLVEGQVVGPLVFVVLFVI